MSRSKYSRRAADAWRSKALRGKNTFSIEADLSGLDALLGQLEDGAAEAVRPMAQAAAQVFYDRVKTNVKALGRETGNLEDSIYQAFSPEKSQDGKRAEYHVSWNHKTAPHGHLVEYGYLQRYRYYKDNQGAVRPMVRPGMDGKPRPGMEGKPRPGMEGKPRPGRHASQAEKDAYYVTLPTPKQVPGKAFVRSAGSALPDALRAAEDELLRRIFERGAYYGA